MSNDANRSKTASATSVAFAEETALGPARIGTTLEALNQFPQLLEQSDSSAHRRGENMQERRLSTTLLSPLLVEQLMKMGGDTELLIEPGTSTPTTIRISTLARLIVCNLPVGTEVTHTSAAVAATDSFLQYRSYRSVPWVNEVLKLRARVFGADASNETAPAINKNLGAADVPAAGVLASAKPATSASAAKRPSAMAVALTPLAALDARLSALASNTKENHSHAALKRLKERLYRRPPQCHTTSISALDSLARDFPNFLPLIDQYRSELQLKRLLKAPLVLRPTLLVGPPGIGKTAFMRRLCSALKLHHLPCAVATMTAAWILNGKHGGWRGSSAGLVAEGMLALPDGEGLMLQLDELDKMPRNLDNFPVEPVLLELLEPISRQSFRDEYLELPLNLLPFLSVLATANQLHPISAPLLSRFQVVRVEAPTKEQMPAVVRSVDQMMRSTEPALMRVFAPLADSVKAALGTLPPRQVYQMLEGAYGCAAARSRVGAKNVAVTVGDIDISLKRLGEGKRGPTEQAQSKTGKDDEVDAYMVIRLRGDGNPEGGSGGGSSGSGGGHGTRLH